MIGISAWNGRKITAKNWYTPLRLVGIITISLVIAHFGLRLIFYIEHKNKHKTDLKKNKNKKPKQNKTKPKNVWKKKNKNFTTKLKSRRNWWFQTKLCFYSYFIERVCCDLKPEKFNILLFSCNRCFCARFVVTFAGLRCITLCFRYILKKPKRYI